MPKLNRLMYSKYTFGIELEHSAPLFLIPWKLSLAVDEGNAAQWYAPLISHFVTASPQKGSLR